MKTPLRNFVAATTVLLLLVSYLASARTARYVRSEQTHSPDDIMERVHAKYAALQTYSDTGVVTTESAPPDAPGAISVERHTFSTFYRTPRQFFFEFIKDPKVGSERFVVWADGADFNTWWSATKVHEVYPKGQGATAFALATFPTKDSVMKISPLLFAQAGLHGSIADFKATRLGEAEDVGGRRCYKVIGEVGLAYGTGAVTSVRPTIIWIDTETLMVRKILEDTPNNVAGTDRMTTTFEPQANPKIDDARFKFVVPTGS